MEDHTAKGLGYRLDYMYSTCTCTVLFTGHYRIYKLTCRKSVEVSEAVCGTFIGTPTVQYLWACVTRLPRCFKPIGVSASLRRGTCTLWFRVPSSVRFVGAGCPITNAAVRRWVVGDGQISTYGK